MKILVVGSGAREHAILHTLAQNQGRHTLYVAPGNPGMRSIAKIVPLQESDTEGLIAFCKRVDIDLTVVGPEGPLCTGLVDRFAQAGLAVFGPSQKSARLEASKRFSKDFFKRHQLPSAAYQSAQTLSDAQGALRAFLEHSPSGRAVLKADGLCAGKGVRIVSDQAQGEAFLREIFIQKSHGAPAVVVEEFLQGPETSLLCLYDGHTLHPMPSVRDHKKQREGEQGPNTGGMGSYSPDPEADRQAARIRKEILEPLQSALQEEGLGYTGVLFAGLMLTQDGPKLLEINVRLGDPECQSVLARLQSDLGEVMSDCLRGRLDPQSLRWSSQKAVSVVLASRDYPEKSAPGGMIELPALLDSSRLRCSFGAVLEGEGGALQAGSGRVLTLTALGDTAEEARREVYQACQNTAFEGKRFRQDIGERVERVLVKKRPPFQQTAELTERLRQEAGLTLAQVVLYQRYDLQGLSPFEISQIQDTVLADPACDEVIQGEALEESLKRMGQVLVVQDAPGQYSAREDALLQCISLALGRQDVKVKSALLYELQGCTEPDGADRAARVLINPVDQERGSTEPVWHLEEPSSRVPPESVIAGMIDWTPEQLRDFYEKTGLAMKYQDLVYFTEYFKEQNRDPWEVELAMVDTYWSDHCRHTTFNTALSLQIQEGPHPAVNQAVRQALALLEELREECAKREQPISLMQLATIAARAQTSRGQLQDQEVSEEINACSVRVPLRLAGDQGQTHTEPWLLMFKNETHNHPTEIEPFGGAGTCLGGAIRDPLSGRAYVYQAMRLTGSADPRAPYSQTLPGKLPQRQITTQAARGYSAYGNQIGLCTGFVDECYHPGFLAKRMEIGAVIAAAPQSQVRRETPQPGDSVLLIGGRTGRDGVGGATGSSKEHKEDSLETAGAQVQRGNPPTERKIQRLFRDPEVSKKIKKCNDFGAGGVAVAIGELAAGLRVDLDQVPLKYPGLSAREIAISESQERMAVVVDPADEEAFFAACARENVPCARVAEVTHSPRLVMTHRGQVVADIGRDFLDSAGVPCAQEALLQVPGFPASLAPSGLSCADLPKRLADLNHCSRQGLIEQFDQTVGASTLLLPLGGRYQAAPSQAMAARLPHPSGRARTASVMSCGYDPYVSEQSPFHGAYLAVVESVCRNVACGGDHRVLRLSLQEYFQKLGTDPALWGLPAQALLGALQAQMDLQVPAIGGKDSMSGSFENLHVPPTLVSFAVSYTEESAVTGQALAEEDSQIIWLPCPLQESGLPDPAALRKRCDQIVQLRDLQRPPLAAWALSGEGYLTALAKMAFGSDVSLDIQAPSEAGLPGPLDPAFGSFLLQLRPADAAWLLQQQTGARLLAQVQPAADPLQAHFRAVHNQKRWEWPLRALQDAYEASLQSVFPFTGARPAPAKGEAAGQSADLSKSLSPSAGPVSKQAQSPGPGVRPLSKNGPKVLIPVFPGTNCEEDSRLAFEQAGAQAHTQVFRNLTPQAAQESIEALCQAIRDSHIICLPGGFSLGDEPDGSGKFIAQVLRHPRVSEAIEDLLHRRDGLMVGICNGFQGLVRAGYLPEGAPHPHSAQSAVLFQNAQGRHMTRLVQTRVMSTRSPWMSQMRLHDVHRIPISHGEGRFVAPQELLERLMRQDQIAFCYADEQGDIAAGLPHNPNGSMLAIEGLLSPCGRILGKMGHTERLRPGLYRNYPAFDPQPLFESAVSYYRQ